MKSLATYHFHHFVNLHYGYSFHLSLQCFTFTRFFHSRGRHDLTASNILIIQHQNLTKLFLVWAILKNQQQLLASSIQQLPKSCWNNRTSWLVQSQQVTSAWYYVTTLDNLPPLSCLCIWNIYFPGNYIRHLELSYQVSKTSGCCAYCWGSTRWTSSLCGLCSAAPPQCSSSFRNLCTNFGPAANSLLFDRSNAHARTSINH